jgi:hypothetical protein
VAAIRLEYLAALDWNPQLQGAVVWFYSPENAGKDLDGIHV